jgi:hypothetical protein
MNPIMLMFLDFPNSNEYTSRDYTFLICLSSHDAWTFFQ